MIERPRKLLFLGHSPRTFVAEYRSDPTFACTSNGRFFIKDGEAFLVHDLKSAQRLGGVDFIPYNVGHGPIELDDHTRAFALSRVRWVVDA